jgi:hypothetical protein
MSQQVDNVAYTAQLLAIILYDLYETWLIYL